MFKGGERGSVTIHEAERPGYYPRARHRRALALRLDPGVATIAASVLSAAVVGVGLSVSPILAAAVVAFVLLGAVVALFDVLGVAVILMAALPWLVVLADALPRLTVTVTAGLAALAVTLVARPR